MTNSISTFYSRWDRQINFLIVFAGILIIYQLRYGLIVLNPTYDAWLMTHDWATHHLSWFFYRNEPWTFPLGEVSKYLFPVGTNVGFTDSIPLAAIFFKIFSPILPDTFQYVGPWLFMCHALTAYFLIKLFEGLSLRGILALAATLIVTFNPVLLHRSIHPALCSHWLLIGSLWVYTLDPEKYSATRLLMFQAIFLIVGCLINPYFSLFEAGFFAALALRLYAIDKKIKLLRLTGISAAVCAVLFISWFAIGFFSFKNQGDLGVSGAYGLYAFNLNSLFNSGGWSAFYGHSPLVSWHQYESFMYLGMGMLILVPATIIVWVVKRKKIATHPLFTRKRIFWIPLVIFCATITLFAITNIVTFNDHVLFSFGLFEKAQKIADIFRASARYAWVLYYGLIIFTILSFTRLVKNRAVAFASLISVFALQMFDYRSLIMAGAKPATYSRTYHTPLQESEWRGMIEKTGSVVFYPPFEATYLTDTDYRYFCYLAADYEKPINLGYAARNDNVAMVQYARTLKAQLENGDIDPNALYVTTADHVARFFVPFEARQLYCVKLDGFYAFYPASLKEDAAFASLSLEAPNELLTKKIFESYDLKPGDREEDLAMEIEQIERSRLSIFVKGWTRGDSTSVANLMLRSKEGRYFLASAGEVTATDTIWFRGTVFTDNLPAGQYEVGAYVHPIKEGSSGTLSFFSTISVGTQEKFVATESTQPRPNSWIDLVEESRTEVKIHGWAFLEGQSSMHNRISLVFRSDSKTYTSPTDPLLRPDVSQFFGGSVNISTCGFAAIVSLEKMETGSYEIGIRINNDKLGVETTEYMGRYFSVK